MTTAGPPVRDDQITTPPDVPAAVESFANALLRYRRNPALADRLASGELSPASFTAQLTCWVYRLIVLRIATRRAVIDPRTPQHTWHDLERTRQTLARDGIPALGRRLWSTELTPDLADASLRIDDADLRPLTQPATTDHALATTYEALLTMEPIFDPDTATFELRDTSKRTRRSRTGRKAAGAYYTPDNLIDCLLDASLEPVIRSRLEQAGPDPRAREAALVGITVCDPAVGTGAFLLAAARRLATHLANIRQPHHPSQRDTDRATADAIHHCLYGVDRDPIAVELCKVNLWLEAGDTDHASLDDSIRHGDALLGTTPDLLAQGIPDAAYRCADEDRADAASHHRRINRRQRRETPIDPTPGTRAAADAWCAAFVWPKDDRNAAVMTTGTLHNIGPHDANNELHADAHHLARHHAFFHWHLEFPHIFRNGGFDVVLGNPPFINAIEGGVTERTKGLLRTLHPRVGGTSDLGYYFLDRAVSLVRPDGRVAMIQPRAVLNAAPVETLRAWANQHLPPVRIYAPARADFFNGAAVYICALVLAGDATRCQVSTDDDPASATWTDVDTDTTNWWLMVADADGATPPMPPGRPLADLFEISASMTAGDAYEVRPYVRDDPDPPGLKLVTTGLIDPDRCDWGDTTCRYLKHDYQHPRVDVNDNMSPALQRRLTRAQRPKVIVAGLSRRVECFLDLRGHHVGAVSTFTIYHPDDNLNELARLRDTLLSDWVTARFRAELAGNALGGGNTTMTKRFLARLTMP